MNAAKPPINAFKPEIKFIPFLDMITMDENKKEITTAGKRSAVGK
ncbi:MAG: hypothetical protein ACOC53_04440 [Candidatus Saliniplasma sp.]